MNVYLTLSQILNKKYEVITGVVEFEINNIPIQLNPWNKNRIFDNFYIINDKNVLSAEKGKTHISNMYLYPMNFVMCKNRNHSQFAAISKGEGESFFVDRYDFSELYDLCRFNGSNFIDGNNRIIDLRDKYSSEEVIFAGILFEIGRVRLEEGFENPIA